MLSEGTEHLGGADGRGAVTTACPGTMGASWELGSLPRGPPDGHGTETRATKGKGFVCKEG